MNIKGVLIIEGISDLLLMGIKFTVGITTGSNAILSDAFHSFTDLANNGIALVALHISEQASDDNHHYGHKKFEQLAVLLLAVLLSVVAIELVLNALRNHGKVVEHSSAGLAVLLVALGINIALTGWQHYWARRFHSDLLNADAKHTLSDVLTTAAVIIGWQFAASGHYWVDTLMAIVVAVIILVLAANLLVKSIPILVDQSNYPPQTIAAEIGKVELIDKVGLVRARNTPDGSYADVTISINADISTRAAHVVTEQIEELLKNKFDINDVVVHVEPTEISDS